MDNQPNKQRAVESNLLEEGVNSYRKRVSKRTTKKKVNLRKEVAKEVEEL